MCTHTRLWTVVSCPNPLYSQLLTLALGLHGVWVICHSPFVLRVCHAHTCQPSTTSKSTIKRLCDDDDKLANKGEDKVTSYVREQTLEPMTDMTRIPIHQLHDFDASQECTK